MQIQIHVTFVLFYPRVIRVRYKSNGKAPEFEEYNGNGDGDVCFTHALYL